LALPLFDATVDGRLILTRSTQPLLDGARGLLAAGVDPASWIVMRRAGSDTDALRSTVGAAAKLTVEEGEHPPTLRPWKPSPHAAVTPPMRPIDQPANAPASRRSHSRQRPHKRRPKGLEAVR
jgi:hypothetical protein